jgi:serine/threonine protein kinase
MQRLPLLEGYQLLGTLGGGPMTAVYSARATATDTPCAIKVVRAEWEDQETAIKLLQREARAALMVRHPHLVRVVDTHVTSPPYFLVMDLLAGESLRRRLRRDYRLPATEAVWIMRQTAEAVAALHRRGFLHGDLKPDNIRLIDDGTAMLIDLGFAHRPGENTALRRAGYLLGTANYLAPELCDEAPAEDLGSDLFSLGVMFFEMLSGKLPYPPGSISQTVRRHHCDPPAALRGSVGNLPAALVNLVERLLARRPEDRPRAAAVVQQLVKLEIATLRRRRSA